MKCHICTYYRKDIKILTCGHKLCTKCWDKWQNQHKNTCPWCRQEQYTPQDFIKVKTITYLERLQEYIIRDFQGCFFLCILIVIILY